MSVLDAVFFGLVQGITEFLPVSSSAHLSVLFNLFGVAGSGFNAKAFSVFLHFGTIIAVLIMYWQDFAEIVFEVLEFTMAGGQQEGPKRARFPAVRLLLMMVIAILPLFLVLPLSGTIAELFNKNGIIGFMLILSGTALTISDHFFEGSKTERNMTFSDAIIMGLCQAVSAIPGISRTGIVYGAGVAVGLKRTFSAKFAVMLSVPVMFGANIVRLIDAGKEAFSFRDLPPCLIGMAAAIVGGIASVSILKRIAEKGKFTPVGYYCWVAGVLAIILTMIF